MNKILYLPIFLLAFQCSAMEEEEIDVKTLDEKSEEDSSLEVVYEETSLQTVDQLCEKVSELVKKEDDIFMLKGECNDTEIEGLYVNFSDKINELEIAYRADNMQQHLAGIDRLLTACTSLCHAFAHDFLTADEIENERIPDFKLLCDRWSGYLYVMNNHITGPRSRVFQKMQALEIVISDLTDSLPGIKKEIKDLKKREAVWNKKANTILTAIALLPQKNQNNVKDDSEEEMNENAVDESSSEEADNEKRDEEPNVYQRKESAAKGLIQALGMYYEASQKVINESLKGNGGKKYLNERLKQEEKIYNQLLGLIQTMCDSEQVCVAKKGQDDTSLNDDHSKILLRQQADALSAAGSILALRKATEEELENRKKLIKFHKDNYNRLDKSHESYTKEINKNKKLRIELMMCAPKKFEWDDEDNRLKKEVERERKALEKERKAQDENDGDCVIC